MKNPFKNDVKKTSQKYFPITRKKIQPGGGGFGNPENRAPDKVAYDVWNAYEVSAITEKGRPVTGLLKISYPCDSNYLVESKSIKLCE